MKSFNYQLKSDYKKDEKSSKRYQTSIRENIIKESKNDINCENSTYRRNQENTSNDEHFFTKTNKIALKSKENNKQLSESHSDNKYFDLENKDLQKINQNESSQNQNDLNLSVFHNKNNSNMGQTKINLHNNEISVETSFIPSDNHISKVTKNILQENSKSKIQNYSLSISKNPLMKSRYESPNVTEGVPQFNKMDSFQTLQDENKNSQGTKNNSKKLIEAIPK